MRFPRTTGSNAASSPDLLPESVLFTNSAIVQSCLARVLSSPLPPADTMGSKSWTTCATNAGVFCMRRSMVSSKVSCSSAAAGTAVKSCTTVLTKLRSAALASDAGRALRARGAHTRRVVMRALVVSVGVSAQHASWTAAALTTETFDGHSLAFRPNLDFFVKNGVM